MPVIKPIAPIPPVRSLADAIALPLHYESPVGDRYARNPSRHRLIRQMDARRQQFTRRS